MFLFLQYHGGTNFDRTAGGPYITTSYDYDAPLDEYGKFKVFSYLKIFQKFLFLLTWENRLGNLNQPKYGHLKQLHDVLHSMERTLTYGNISTIDFGNSASVILLLFIFITIVHVILELVTYHENITQATIYKTEEGSSCFFGNGNEKSDATISFQGESYVVPAWSVTILPDCKNEAYNTAKVFYFTFSFVD